MENGNGRAEWRLICSSTISDLQFPISTLQSFVPLCRRSPDCQGVGVARLGPALPYVQEIELVLREERQIYPVFTG